MMFFAFHFSEDAARIEEVFVGYNKDTAAGVILKAWESCKRREENYSDDENEDRVFIKVNPLFQADMVSV